MTAAVVGPVPHRCAGAGGVYNYRKVIFGKPKMKFDDILRKRPN